LTGEFFDVPAGGERHYAEAFRHRLHHLERLAADGAGRTEYG
jgi:hypothetical protein